MNAHNATESQRYTMYNMKQTITLYNSHRGRPLPRGFFSSPANLHPNGPLFSQPSSLTRRINPDKHQIIKQKLILVRALKLIKVPRPTTRLLRRQDHLLHRLSITILKRSPIRIKRKRPEATRTIRASEARTGYCVRAVPGLEGLELDVADAGEAEGLQVAPGVAVVQVVDGGPG